MKIICPACMLELRPKKTGVLAEAMADFGSYLLFSADLMECPGCNLEVVSHFGPKPMAQHFHPGYELLIAGSMPSFRFWATKQEKQRYEESVLLRAAEDLAK